MEKSNVFFDEEYNKSMRHNISISKRMKRNINFEGRLSIKQSIQID